MAEVERKRILAINQKGWNEVAHFFYGGTALPKYGPLALTEDDLQLIDNLKGKAVLELGCGSGHTLHYLAKVKKASELWGIDLSQEQIHFTQEYLDHEGIHANLFLASMDENPGIPENHFDLVVSIYSLGWTPDLFQTIFLVNAYLKPGGCFIFSWEHPVYHCLDYRDDIGCYTFTRSYQEEGPEIDPSWKGVKIVLNPRKLSTFLNSVIDAGLVLEKVIESDANPKLARKQDFAPDKWYSIPRAQLISTTFIVKARKPG
jgi:SAM-dependent methyltransferase